MVKAYAMMGCIGGLLFTIGMGAHDMQDYMKQSTLLILGSVLGSLTVYYLKEADVKGDA